MLLKNRQGKLGGGANQSSLREYNERTILSLIRRNGALAKAELAKLTGLSAQSMSVIIGSLEKEGLLIRGSAQRGKVGQPSIPMMLNPDGVFTIGLKIGRRRTEVVLMDFTGQLRCVKHSTYDYPVLADILDFTRQSLVTLRATLSAEQQQRIIGLGVAMPYELWNWAQEIGASQEAIDAWRNIDFAAALTNLCDYPVSIQNDGASACSAELIFGRGAQLADFAYLFIGFFIGGGIVLNNSLFTGPQGNAAAFGSMPVIGPQGQYSQLIEHASLALLEKQLRADNIATDFLWDGGADWGEYDRQVQTWITYIAKYIALAVVSSCSVIDFNHVVIDGAFPASVRARLVVAVERALQDLDLQGVRRPQIQSASLTTDPRVLGSACQPLFEHYLLDQSLLFQA